MSTIAVEFFQDLSLLGWDWISQRRWKLLLIQFSGERRPARPGPAFPQLQDAEADPAPGPDASWGSNLCSLWRLLCLITGLVTSSVILQALLLKPSTCIILLLLALSWLVVCQHLTKHLQTFSHSLPRPSFPYVLLRLQYVSSPRKCPNGSILQHQLGRPQTVWSKPQFMRLPFMSFVPDFCDLLQDKAVF